MGHRKRVDLGPEDFPPDPVDLPYEPRPLKPYEAPCAHPGCVVPIMRLGGGWWHVAATGDLHRPRPAAHHG